MIINDVEIFTSKCNCKIAVQNFLVSKQLRRIKGKKQVFSKLGSEDKVDFDYIHERLLHSLEVLSISKEILSGICQMPIIINREESIDSISIIGNEDLLDSISIAHDFGHTPFGHIGETAISDFMKGVNTSIVNRKNSCKIKNSPLFKHNVYSSVLLSRDTNYYHYDIIDGVLKHSDINKLNGEIIDSRLFGLNSFLPDDLRSKPSYLINDFPYTLEGQIVALADEIAQILSDIEDSYITSNDNFFSRNINPDLQSFSKRRDEKLKNYLKRLRKRFVESAINETRENIKQILIGLKTYPVVLTLHNETVKLCPIENDALCKIKDARAKFLHKKPIIVFQNGASYLIIYKVFDYFLNNPLEWFKKDQKAPQFLIKQLIVILNNAKTKKDNGKIKFDIFSQKICQEFEWGEEFIKDLNSLLWPSEFSYKIDVAQRKILLFLCDKMRFYYFNYYSFDKVMDSLSGSFVREVGFTIAKMTDRFAHSVFCQSFKKHFYRIKLLFFVKRSLKNGINTVQFSITKKDSWKVYFQILELGS